MSTGPLVAETLRAWRDAERFLESVPPDTPDHETALLLVAQLRQLYGELTTAGDASETRLRASTALVARATATLARLDGKDLEAAER